MIKIKTFEEILKNQNEYEIKKIIPPHQSFGNLFNAYTKAINKGYNRHGALFERPFKRKLIDNEAYLRSFIKYIHYNPVNHGFCENPIEYPWSSYLTCVSEKPTKLKREKVISLFDNRASLEASHNQRENFTSLEQFLNL